ncbi:MAG: bifunctional cytidylyltransferase/SDR family oxidoreductase [Bifidobacteriaceae bacterium]|nr:bifunctional cytidylyltransferase/SDR family oxidoreductase [Bifidobacteriaceae bacterium]
MKTYGVVLAGGVGARLGLSVPKQMVKVAGKTILEHTVGVFQASPLIDDIIVMITPGWTEEVATLLGDRYRKLSLILEGGHTRNETTRRVIEAIEDAEAKVLLHDAVRPLVDERIIAACVRELDRNDAVDTAIPSADTIVMVDEDEVITKIPDRSRLRRGQTPQAFKLSVLRAAYERAIEDPYFHATDDCGVVVRYLPDVDVKCITGSENNIKVTHAVDLFIADKLFQLAAVGAPHKTPDQLAAALAGRVVVVLGGSYGIGAEIARLAKAAGATVIAHGRSTTGLHVQDLAAIEQALAGVAAEHGRIDAVILTAGLLKTGPLAAMPPEEISEVIAVNYTAAVNVARAAFPHLAATHGHLLLFTSSSYTRGRENYALYSSSKAAVVNLTQALSEEWAADGVKVNVVNPERTDTPMRRDAFGQEPAGTLLSAEQVAQASLDTITSDLTGIVVDVRRSQEAAA